jgi:hypothetical protein
MKRKRPEQPEEVGLPIEADWPPGISAAIEDLQEALSRAMAAFDKVKEQRDAPPSA